MTPASLDNLAAEFSRSLPMDERILSVGAEAGGLRVHVTDYTLARRLRHRHRGVPVRYTINELRDIPDVEVPTSDLSHP